VWKFGSRMFSTQEPRSFEDNDQAIGALDHKSHWDSRIGPPSDKNMRARSGSFQTIP
jgi:hypothetical protein